VAPGTVPYPLLETLQVRYRIFSRQEAQLPQRNSASRVFNPGIPNPGIPGSRPTFSIPNPGIGDALIPGFGDYKNCKLHAEKVKFWCVFCHNFVEFVAYILRCLCFRLL